MTPCVTKLAGFVVYGVVGLGHAGLLALVVYLAIKEHREGNEYGMAGMWWFMAFAELIFAVVYIGLAIQSINEYEALCIRELNSDVVIEGPPSIRTSFKNSVYTINSANLYGDTDYGQASGGLRVEDRKCYQKRGFLAGAFGEQPTHRIIFIGNQAQSAARFSEQGRTITGERVQGSNPSCIPIKVNVKGISRLPVKNEAGHILNRTLAHVREEKVERYVTVANNTIGQHLRELSPEHPDEQVRAVGKLALLPVEVSLRSQQRKLFSGQVKALFHQASLPHGNACQYERSKGYGKIGYCTPVHTTTVATQKRGLEVTG